MLETLGIYSAGSAKRAFQRDPERGRIWRDELFPVIKAREAGTFTIKIIIPSQPGDDLVFEDDVSGLTPAKFSS